MIQSTKAIVLKELRENLVWAMLACAMITGALAVGVSSGADSGLPLLQKSFISLCVMVFPLAGASLGWLQIYQDSRPGRYPFIAHRPTSRSHTFAGKILVGFLLYAIVALIPLGLITAYVAAPGRVPGPFTWDMTEPALAYLGSGMMWYATGLLVASRKARWFGSRLMPVSIAILGMLAFNAFAVAFIDAVAIIIPCTLLLVAAAWGAFIAGDDSANAPAGFKPWIGLSVAAGWLLIVVTLMAIIGQVIESYLPFRTFSTSSYYALDPHGKLLEVEGSWTPGKNFLATTPINLNTNYTSLASRVATAGFLKAESHALRFYSSGTEAWYYLAGRKILAEYRIGDARYIGSIGENGFSEPGHDATPFGEPISGALNYFNDWQNLLVLSNSVFSIDATNHRVQKVFSTGPDDPVLGAANLPPVDSGSGSTPYDCVIATKSAIHFLHHDRQVLAIPREQGLSHLSVGRTVDGRYVTAYGMTGPRGWNPVSVRIYDSTANLVSRTDRPANPQAIPREKFPWWFEAGAVLPSPPAFFAMVYTLHALHGKALTLQEVGVLPGVFTAYGIAALLMLRARHTNRLQLIIWLSITAVLGLTGILLLMSMWEKPRSVRCPSCGKRRLITEASCPTCGTAAVPPKMEGIEIF
jgi:hypothetical protein